MMPGTGVRCPPTRANFGSDRLLVFLKQVGVASGQSHQNLYEIERLVLIGGQRVGRFRGRSRGRRREREL